MERSRVFLIANIGSLVAVLAVVVNLVLFREVWILAAAAVTLAALSIYAVRERNRIRKQEQQQ